MASEKLHLRHCILFAFQLKKNAAEAAAMICSALGEDVVTHKTCKKWFQRFRAGVFDLADRERPGQPKKFEDEELKQLLIENSGQSEQELAQQLGVIQQTISYRLHRLGKIQKLGRWIPQELSLENKERRFDTAMSSLTRFKKKDFLHRIIIGDEKWVFYDNSKRRKSSAIPGEQSTPKSNILIKKVLLCIWWNIKGVVYYELLEPSQTINSERYQQQLIRLSDELEKKRLIAGEGTMQVILQHDNARPSIVKGITDVIYSLGWEVLPHAAYSPDLTPSDYHLFRSLQHHLADTNFKTVEEIRKCIDDFIDSKPPSFFEQGIRQLPDRWRKVVQNDGGYFKD